MTVASNSTGVPDRRHEQKNDLSFDEDIEYSLDYETGLLKTSSVSCAIPSVAATSSTNDDDTTGRFNALVKFLMKIKGNFFFTFLRSCVQ